MCSGDSCCEHTRASSDMLGKYRLMSPGWSALHTNDPSIRAVRFSVFLFFYLTFVCRVAVSPYFLLFVISDLFIFFGSCFDFLWYLIKRAILHVFQSSVLNFLFFELGWRCGGGVGGALQRARSGLDVFSDFAFFACLFGVPLFSSALGLPGCLATQLFSTHRLRSERRLELADARRRDNHCILTVVGTMTDWDGTDHGILLKIFLSSHESTKSVTLCYGVPLQCTEVISEPAVFGALLRSQIFHVHFSFVFGGSY